MTRQMTVKFPAALDYDRRPHAIGYHLEISAGPYENYGHAYLSIYARPADAGSEDRWRKVATITAQCSRITEHTHREAPRSHYALRYGQKLGTNTTTTDLETTWSKWYAVQLDLSAGNDYYTDGVAGDCARAAVVSQVWEKVDATVEAKNLAYKYDDGLTYFIAALNVLGAQSLERTSDGWTMQESFSLTGLR